MEIKRIKLPVKKSSSANKINQDDGLRNWRSAMVEREIKLEVRRL